MVIYALIVDMPVSYPYVEMRGERILHHADGAKKSVRVRGGSGYCDERREGRAIARAREHLLRVVQLASRPHCDAYNISRETRHKRHLSYSCGPTRKTKTG